MVGSDVTQTAASGADHAAAAAPAQIGRYAIEGVLGTGGMGVVYAAYDPDLDRRIALKVLHSAISVGTEGRARLLREARAMAKLAHPNVIAVHEVGTDGGVDFVAMDLIDGRSVAEWLAAGRRPRGEVLRVFRAAGEGLAAAHAVGLVHRDFKPHNVLLGHDGRVVVTDFGLARAAEERDASPTLPGVADATRPMTGLEDTVAPLDSGETPARAPRAGDGSAPGIGALTRTGAVVGTPAYMPPEQHVGGAPEPRGDQFSFCVAVWEALDGARPFPGDTIDELRKAVTAGVPAGGGDLPRALRAVLARGLAVDPARRWPSMKALLAALAAAEARPRRLAVAGVLGVAAAAIAAVAALWPGPAAPPCALPASHIDAAWSPARRAALPADVAAVAAAAFDRARADWLEVRAVACAAPAAPAYPARLACLRDAGDRLAALVAAVAEAPAAQVRVAEVTAMAPEPAICRADPPPSVPAPAADPAELAARRKEIEALALAVRADELDGLAARVERLIADARRSASCAARGEALVAAARALDALDDLAGMGERAEEASSEAARCGDDLVAARAALQLFDRATQTRQAAPAIAALRERARAAIDRAGRPLALSQQLALVETRTIVMGNRIDEALATLERMEQRLAAAGRPIEAARMVGRSAGLLAQRAGAGDLDRAERRINSALAVLEPALGDSSVVIGLRTALASLRWQRGDAAGFRALRSQVRAYWASPAGKTILAAQKRPDLGLSTFTGTVVDDSGRAVAGATVVAAPWVVADSEMLDPFDFGTDPISGAVTDRNGRFTLQAPPSSLIVAQGGRLRAAPQPARSGQTLRLVAPTRVTGRVTSTAPRPGNMTAAVRRVLPSGGGIFLQYAPVAADGRFVLEDVPPGRYDVWVHAGKPDATRMTGRPIDVRGTEVGPFELDWNQGSAALEIRIRGSRGVIESAQVWVAPGVIEASNVAELNERLSVTDARQLMLHKSDPEATRRARELGVDLHGRVDGLSPGEYTACAIPLADLGDAEARRRMIAHNNELEVACTRARVTDQGGEVTIEAAPMKRLPP